MTDSTFLIDNLCTHGFHIIDNFLELNQCRLIQEQAQQMYAQGLFRGAKIGLNLDSHNNKGIRADEICWLDEEEQHPALQHYLQQVDQLARLLNQELFLGLHEFETHLAAYQPGSYYKKHIDQFAAKKNRKISCVYYLNQDWCAHFGGELMLYNQDEQLIQLILPQENRFICFNSELPHEVCLTHQPRYSIAGWLKTRA